MRWLMEAVKGGMYKLNVYDAKCTQPAHLKGRDIANLTQADFNCSTQRDGRCNVLDCMLLLSIVN
ncbi:hypothetical protein DPMN_161871 [Dreissena polymorpha]|uniref:Uncharacterized protein n=1 Tax=Dreissena polymorpha TaxID=45954 RepID=A0A9D4IQ18_DREPO|nr:hypothetical protein DPMN_161871 [Dreissena polymorpha]